MDSYRRGCFRQLLPQCPLFLIMRDLRLVNTRLSLVIVYTAFNLPFVVWMMRGFFAEIRATSKKRRWLTAIHAWARLDELSCP